MNFSIKKVDENDHRGIYEYTPHLTAITTEGHKVKIHGESKKITLFGLQKQKEGIVKQREELNDAEVRIDELIREIEKQEVKEKLINN